MRKIKFKFYCKEHKFVESGFGEKITEIHFDQRGEVGLACPLCFKSRPMKLLQYTGLKDKNGKEIYEGDICYITDGWGNEWTSKVEWGDMHGDKPENYPAFDLSPQVDEELNSFASVFESGDHTIEVIGNIYENLELLRENK